MKILIFTWEFPPLLGGAGSFNRDLSVALKELGHQVTVLTAAVLPHKKNGAENTDPALKGVEIVYLNWSHPWGLWTVPKLLKEYLKKYRKTFDCFWLTESKAQAVSAKVPAHFLDEYSIIVHGDEMDRHFGPQSIRQRVFYSKRRTKKLFSNAKQLLGISQFTVDRMARWGYDAKKILLGVDPKLFSPPAEKESVKLFRAENGISENALLVATAGRLEKAKGHHILIRAVAELRKEFPQLVLALAGDGQDKKEMERLVQNLHCGEPVLFLGRLARKDLQELFRSADLFALNSRSENFGLVYLEANACGTPVLGTRVGGVPEAVEDGVSGVLVNPDSVDETVGALGRFFRDSPFRHRLAEEGYRRYLEGFTHLHMAQQVLRYAGVSG